MDKYKLEEVVNTKDKKIRYIWHPGVIPEGVPVDQVYGFANDIDNNIVIVRDKDEQRFTPPGGGVEKGETPLEALKREFLEEVQFEPKNIKLMGSLEVVNPSAEDVIQRHNLQVRFVCEVDGLKKFEPLKNGFEIIERKFVFYLKLPEYVNYMKKYKTGNIQYQMYRDYLEGKIKL